MKAIIAIFDCGCSYESSLSNTVIVQYSNSTELDDIINKLNIQSPYGQCEPSGHREHFVVDNINSTWQEPKGLDLKHRILSYKEFYRIWSERYIIDMVYGYWQKIYHNCLDKGMKKGEIEAYDIMMNYYGLDYYNLEIKK